MRYYPDKNDNYDVEDCNELNVEDCNELNVEDWMKELLKRNPSYCNWGPYEDYMAEEGGWNCPQFYDSWNDFGPWTLDNLNEVVNFYFEIERNSVQCKDCDGSGYNSETKKMSDDWYSFDKTKWIYSEDNKRKYNDLAWQYHLTQVEIDALWSKGRLKIDYKEKPTPEQVNKKSKFGFGHDAINQWICVEARAKHLGIYGHCQECNGKGYIYTEPKGHANLILWILHPRKGCSRGIEIKNIQKKELPEIFIFLKEAAKRNSDRFSGIME